MSFFTYKKNHLFAHDVDVARMAKNLEKLVLDLSAPPQSINKWSHDKWQIAAAKLLGAASLHAAQLQAKNSLVSDQAVPPEISSKIKNQISRRESLMGTGIFSSLTTASERPEFRALFSDEMLREYPAGWRSLVIKNIAGPDANISRFKPNTLTADLVVGDANDEIVQAIAAYHGKYGALIDFREAGAFDALAKLARQNMGMLVTYTCFVGLRAALGDDRRDETLNFLIEYARKRPRNINVISLHRKDLDHFIRPKVGANHLDAVMVHDLDLVFDEMSWSKHIEIADAKLSPDAVSD